MKHTFGRRLCAAGVSFEDHQDLLEHRAGRITTHYSAAELQNLYEMANKAFEAQSNGVLIMMLRNPIHAITNHKSHSHNVMNDVINT